MIPRGKAEGWLKLPSEAFLSWALYNEVSFDRTIPGVIAGRGGALLAKDPLDGDLSRSPVLLRVPKDLVLSLERVQQHAKVDKDFREVLDSLGDFGRTPRGAILSFLLFQSYLPCPHLSSHIGVHNPFTEYVKSLPLEDLPTFWPPSELQLLIGTTLAPAISSKLRSLRREYGQLCNSAAGTRWYAVVQEYLDFEDWLQADAMYRSRALDFPEIGHCMVPCIDLANHAAGEDTVAIYEKDATGDAVLLLRDGQSVAKGDEVTITYGDEKGACEMVFSYGFLEDGRESAEMLFLSLSLPDDDPAAQAKMEIADCAPGFKLMDAGGDEIKWTGDFIWLLCITFDDGLQFEIARTTDGEEEVHGLFNGEELTGGAAQLREMLAKSELWDVYRLRAIAILQQRVFDQLQVLYRTQDDLEEVPHGEGTEVRDGPYENAMKLRKLEFELMNRAYESFEKEKSQLAESPVVTRYLAEMNGEPPDSPSARQEDFS